MKPYKLIFLSIFSILFCFFSTVFSHVENIEINGKIIDQETEKPIGNATVFLTLTTYHTTSNSNGDFNLSNVMVGTYAIVCVAEGYHKTSFKIFVNGETNLKAILTLKKVLHFNKNNISQFLTFIDRYKYVEKFKKEFLGESILTYKCAIVNENDLEFNHDGVQLFAQASKPLIIINKALGYKLTFFLNHFAWEWFSDYGDFSYDVYFEKLKPNDSFEAVKFSVNRLETYKGSFRHFLKACATNNVFNEGFVLFYANYVPNELGDYDDFKEQIEDVSSSNVKRIIDKIIKKENEDEFSIELNGYLEVVYKEKKEEFNYAAYKERTYGTNQLYDFLDSWITFPGGKYFFTSKGIGLENDQYSKQLFGYWNWKRVYNLLPIDYDPMEIE